MANLFLVEHAIEHVGRDPLHIASVERAAHDLATATDAEIVCAFGRSEFSMGLHDDGTQETVTREGEVEPAERLLVLLSEEACSFAEATDWCGVFT